MKKVLLRLLLLLLLLPLVLSEDNSLYQQDQLELELKINGDFELVSSSNGASLKSVEANLLLYPQDSFRQKVLDYSTTGKITDSKVTFLWNDGIIEQKKYSYTSLVRTINEQHKVTSKIPFPINDVGGFGEYLKATETIDSDNPAVIKKATELVEGETDLFKAVFKMASWVEENVKYDLNELTAETSQKASWVLEKREGVCDEMTSLFVAMVRSVGVPARFVSGTSFTTSDLFDYPWQSHGWAEVYFPTAGWVSFDITFNQYGYVDVTHIKFRDGFDPKEPATKFSWTGNNVDLVPGKLSSLIEIKKKGNFVPEAILLEQQVLEKEVGFESYNLVKGVVKNTKNYYAATALNLAVPTEVEVIGRNRRNILLAPKEVRETYWLLKVPTLEKNYVYTFPILMYSEKNITVEDSFKVKKDQKVYSQQEIEKLIVQDEEKSYSRKISFDCDFPLEMKKDEKKEFKCSVKNVGNSNLEKLEFCLGGVCDFIDLRINQQEEVKITVEGSEIGWNTVVVSAENDLVEKKESLSYQVLDTSVVKFSIDAPEKVPFGEDFAITIKLDKNSFKIPKKVVILLNGDGFQQKWEIDELTKEETLLLGLEAFPLQRENEFTITVKWDEGEKSSEIVVIGEGDTFSEKFSMFFNSILAIFM